MIDEPSEKVLAMYQAVIDMINEGWDVNAIKVSDITARAGIGKGTAYEYFSSKEEIITMALGHDVFKKQLEIGKIVDGDGSFAEKVKRIFDYVGEQFGKRQTFCTLVRIGTGSYEISEGIRKEYGRMQENIGHSSLVAVLDRLMEQGRKERVFEQSNPGLCRTAFLAQLMAYVSCLVSEMAGEAGCPVEDLGVSRDEAGRFAYESLVKSLNG